MLLLKDNSSSAGQQYQQNKIPPITSNNCTQKNTTFGD